MGELGLLGCRGRRSTAVPAWTRQLLRGHHELAKTDAITPSPSAPIPTSALAIMDFGTEARRRRYVPLLAAGKVLGGFGLTESRGRSDASGTATTRSTRGITTS